MKVLFNTYPMAFDVPGGGEMQLMAYKKYLPDFGVEPTLFDLWNPQFDEFDLVHFFSVVGGSSHFCNHVKKIGLPLVITSSLWVTPETKHLYPIAEIKFQLSLADIIITNSEMESIQLADVFGIPLEKFSVVYNGIESDFLIKEDASIFVETTGITEPFILCVGNIEPRKNQLLLTRAMKAFPNLRLVLMGYARDSAYLKEVLSEGGDQVKYIGPVPHGARLLRSGMRACEAFVIPSTLETPSLAALEAGAQGAKVLITEGGSTREYFNDLVDYLNPYDVNSIIAGIQSVINRPNTNLLEKHIENKYLWSNTVRQLEQLYSTLVSV